MKIFQFKRATTSDLTLINPTPESGEPILDTTLNKIKVGNGTSAYNSLPYAISENNYTTPEKNKLASLQVADTIQTLEDSSSIVWDANVGKTAKLYVTGNRILSPILNPITGDVYSLIVYQDATGTRNLNFHASYKFEVVPPLNKGAGIFTYYQFQYDGTNFICVKYPSFLRSGDILNTPLRLTSTGMALVGTGIVPQTNNSSINIAHQTEFTNTTVNIGNFDGFGTQEGVVNIGGSTVQIGTSAESSIVVTDNSIDLSATNLKSSSLGNKNFSDDAAAAIGLVPIGGFYHTSGTVKIRLV